MPLLSLNDNEYYIVTPAPATNIRSSTGKPADISIIEKNKITIFPASVIIDMAPRSPPIKITRKIKINARKMIIL